MGASEIGAPAGERLDSWKEISAYLKRDPRTLQRWEKKEGLPVHRLLHQSQVSIYAYTAELDAWLASRTVSNGKGAGGGAAEAKPGVLHGPILWVGIALSVALLVAAAFAILRRLTPATPAARTFRQVWTGDEVDYQDAVSPDGRYVSFTDPQTGDLWVRDLKLGQNRRLTNKGKSSHESPAWAWNAAFSPDSKSIAYWWWTDDRTNEVRVVGLSGKGQRTLLRDPNRTSYVLMDWSPDGKFIAAAIERSYQETDLALISARDGSMRVLKRFGPVDIQRAVFSRDGHYLAYDAAAKSTGGDIFIVSTDGKEDQPLIQYPTNEFLVGWSPRGNDIIFGSDRTGATGIWRIAVQQGKVRGEPQLLKDDAGSVLPLTVTRSGSAFMLLDVGLEDIFLAELGNNRPPVRISEHFVGARTSPSFSPDGRSLLYRASRGLAGSALYVRSLDSGQERAIHPRLADLFFPRWAEGGREIEVSGSDGATVGIWRVNPLTGAARLIQNGSRPRVYKPPVGMLGPGSPVLAPDGSGYLVAVRDAPKGYNSLLIVSARGGQPRELVRLKQPERFLAGYTWSPDSRYVFFPRLNSSGTDVLRVPAAGGSIELVGLHMSSIRNISIHPDGKRIAFESGEPDLELWALDGFLSR